MTEAKVRYQDQIIKSLEISNKKLESENSNLKSRVEYLQQINDMLSENISDLRESFDKDHARLNWEIAKLQRLQLQYSTCISEYNLLSAEYKKKINGLISSINKTQ